jgi:succinoglycan biosynthesis protein ExoW
MAEIAVVIPFYQTNTGILIKAVNSVLRQSLPLQQILIVIVDDASPIHAKDELASLATHPSIRIIEQANGGPAAARNKALDNVPDEVQFVAFLDSDDEWTRDHLANAKEALGETDFYFTDHYQLDQTVSAFKRARRIVPSNHPVIGSNMHLHRYAGDMFDQILSGNVIGTSTVVYRFRKFPQLRFQEEFVNAGEDYLFWLDLVRMTDRISFSTLCECTYGAGVNVFAGSGWGTEKSLIRIHYEIKYKKALMRLFALTDAQQAGVGLALHVLRRSFVADVLHRFIRKKPIGRDLLLMHARVDPQSFIYFVPIMVLLAVRR